MARSKTLSKWHHRVLSTCNFHVPPGRGALWTGLGADGASRLGRMRDRFTLEMTLEGASLNNGSLKTELDQDFGAGWGPEKKAVWTWASQKFVSRMSGPVDIFMKQGATRIHAGLSMADLAQIEGKILFDEMMDMDIADQVVGNALISSVQITEFNDKLEPTGTYTMPVSKAWN